ncbi:amidohydrolase [Amycolatopsis mediterranei S699]|uniref:Amidohydrolase n=2 Tax=Amycolatopsis mediterranei TaxID=33910 RepID=A0A0H3DJ36_AMYMU|nr:amidohydrolase family protein [Amycolatopsis mediterranei]ADJ50158.1 amidohydrolase [Amycolatopsis mediterranei U32]AEK47155.1 amidohydrolase [Amycolatopsis mediterranei S699]AFO81866.1 amidohydrolase [Amycolatopsis mediterranei S699]AGT88995.1 amidohydrolase [Amycolatopsis mediterranei RB]KDO07593.1 amidohydrolase [Amycolatopsis mediterranei]
MRVEANRRDFLRWLATAGAGLAAAGVAPAVFVQEAAAAGTDVVVVSGVTVVDGTDGPARPDSAVVLVGDRIAWVGPAAGVPRCGSARVVDGRGRYLVPGLWDMHAHGIDYEPVWPPLFLANGVTGIREMQGYDENRVTRDKIARGELLGPRVVLASSIIDGPVSLLGPPVTQVANAEEARAAVRTAVAQRSDFVKVYFYLPKDAFAAIADECHRQGLPFAGHWPYRLRVLDAARAGQRSFEHLFGLPIATSSRRDEFLARLDATPFDPKAPRDFFNLARELDRQAAQAYDPAAAARHFAGLNAFGSRLSPTFAVNRVISRPVSASANDPRNKYIPREIRDFWADRLPLFAPATSDEIAQQEAYFHAQLRLVGEAHRAGVGILGGTDCQNPYVYPGFSLHDELGFLVEAGLTPRRALQAVTRDAAAFLGRADTAGTITPGKVADLVLLDADPLADIGAVRRIDTVVTAGRVLDRAALDRLLADAEAAANRPAAAANARSVRLPVHGCC